jgi:signal peptidase I
MRGRGLAAGTRGSFPTGWAAGESTSHSQARTAWRRFVFGRNPVRTLRRVIVWATGSLILFHYMLVPIKVTGASMSPTYRDGSVNLINRLSYTRRAPKRGDVVVLNDGEDLILKRVIAVPGETVVLNRGVFYINGRPLVDDFSRERVNWEFDPVTLGANEFFVIGDNRSVSVFGKFRKQAILGKVVF